MDYDKRERTQMPISSTVWCTCCSRAVEVDFSTSSEETAVTCDYCKTEVRYTPSKLAWDHYYTPDDSEETPEGAKLTALLDRILTRVH